VEAPALVFNSQEDFMAAYKAGKLDRDFVAVIRFQGPRANGMPELHALTPALANLQDAGRQVALVTDGRMSGASGKVPAAIHVSPEILAGGPLGWCAMATSSACAPNRHAGSAGRCRRVACTCHGHGRHVAESGGHGPRTVRHVPQQRMRSRERCNHLPAAIADPYHGPA
jgi:hypothetical protein